MSTLTDKKAALLAKIARQKAKQKEQVFTIPDIKLSSHDKQRIAEKTFIPNTKTLANKAKFEDEMREFMTELNGLGDKDFDTPPGGYKNIIVLNGHKSFINEYVNDAVKASDDPEVDRNEIRTIASRKWDSLSTFNKLIWAIQGYGIQKDAEWGRKQFSMDVKRNIKSEDDLRSFINKYLEDNISYDKFVSHWRSNRVDKEELSEEETYNETSDTAGTRLSVTEDDRKRIDDLKTRLIGYEEADTRLEDKISTRNEYLTDLTYSELIKLTKPIIGKKTKEQLVDTIINTEYGPIEMEQSKELSGSELEEFMDKLEREKINRKTTLDELSYQDLVLESTTNKNAPQLVTLIINEEFSISTKKLKDKIFKLGIEINNLSLGKYIPRKSNVRLLKYNERLYREAIVIQIRKIELGTMTYNQLALRASTMNVKGYKYNEGSNKDIIYRILSTEFSGANIDDYVPKVDINEMKAVLKTLDDDQIHVLAYSNGVKNPEKRGKARNIESILSKEFPFNIIKPIQQLVIGRNVHNWSYPKRRGELDEMSTQELKTVSLTLGIDLHSGISNNDLIKSILSHEEYVSKLIPKEDQEKEEIIKKIAYITGAPESRYRLWSISELEARLDYLRDESQEYWVEMERDRLYTKLSQIIDITKNKYSKAKSWPLKKLRKELKKTAGSDWESYKPLIEDHSFVECLNTHQQYEWIEGKITGVWLAGPGGGEPKSDYVFKDISIEEDGHLWYKANKKFFSLQCNDYKKDRIQNGDILTSYTQAGKQVKLMIGFTLIGWKHDIYKSRTHMVDTADGRRVQRTFIIQDELLFNKEKRFSIRNNQMEHERIQDILNSIVSERTTKTIKDVLSKSLLEIAPMKKDYGIIHIDTNSKNMKSIDSNTPYIQILVDTFHDNAEQTNKEFFTKAASLLVFINMPEAKTFRNNLEMEYYLPDILATLSPADKFPEAFRDPNASGKFLEELTASITNRIYKLVMGFAKSEYKAQDPTRRTRTDPSSSVDFNRSIKTRKRIDACSNKDRVNGVKEEEIVYYNEDGQIYCFSVDELYEQLLIQNNLINPDTGKQFDLSFVKRFDELYNKRLADDGLLTGYFQKKYGLDMIKLVDNKVKVDTIKNKRPIIVANIWDIVGKDIAELEDQLSNEKHEDGDEIDEDREIERREVEVDEGIRDSIDIESNDACEYCKNHLSDDSIKSIILHGDESRIINFCSFKCFEDKNDWNKFKAKRSDKKEKKKVKNIQKIKNIQDNVKKNFIDKNKIVEKEVVKLSREETKKRKKIIKKQIKEGLAAYDKIAFPLMNVVELREIAKEKGIKIPGGLSKMGVASFLYKTLHPKSTKGVLKIKTAEKAMIKIETRNDKKKRKRTESVTTTKKKK
jgi:hypothetical protein